MAREFIPQLWWVVPKDGELYLYDGDGNEVYGQVQIRITDTVGAVPEALLKLIVNIASSEEEMKSEIQKMNEQQTVKP